MKSIFLFKRSTYEDESFHTVCAFTNRDEAERALEKYSKRATPLPTPITEEQWIDMKDDVFNKYCETNESMNFNIDEVTLNDYYDLFPDYTPQDLDNAYYNYERLPLIQEETWIINEICLLEPEDDYNLILENDIY